MKLIKMSYPCWEETHETIYGIELRLREVVCKSCLVTKSEFVPRGDPITDRVELDMALDDDWESKPVDDCVSTLLGTACGCEYAVEEDDDNE